MAFQFQARQDQSEQKNIGKQQVPGAETPQGALSVRRNPPRRAKHTPATNDHQLPRNSQPSAASAIGGRFISFSTDELIEAGSPAEPRALPKPSESDISENLRVFLRIRPLEIKAEPSEKSYEGHGKRRAKCPPPNGAGKRGIQKKNAICLVVNNSNSVTLAAPPSSVDSKRGKSEVFDGFSFVFPPESQQKDVYERVLEPLVVDFLGGKSGLLAAMGPTGSGKTHTMFGCPRDPGIVHLALKQIFCHENVSIAPHKLRSYYLSMFEIYSDRGKGERIFDLSVGEADLSLQHSTIRGVQEVMVSNITEAECVIARGMLKRVTAVTNANCQSSRSQCVINIRAEPRIACDEVEIANGPVLTMVDLAGAERERRTGNQGARLLESNFINNTSMIFSLCLRSLLEHQKNPKRALQKHFQNSLLTRYLRDYLEGKRRMALILTAKPGEDDYNDSSFLLRQASPYMRIKFNNVEEPCNAPCRKRYNFPLAKLEHPKRRKCTVDGAKSSKDGRPASEKGDTPEVSNSISEMTLLDELESAKRNNQILQNFSKALWNVLKQYKRKLEVSENDAENLRRKLLEEDSRFQDLAKQLEELKSHHYSCCSHVLHPVTSRSKSDINFELSATALPSTLVAGNKPENFGLNNVDALSELPRIWKHQRDKENGTGDALLDPIASFSPSHVPKINDESMLASAVDMTLSREDEQASDWKTNYESQGGSECQDLKGDKEYLDPLIIPTQSLNTTGVDNNMCHSAEKPRRSPLEMPYSTATASLVEDAGLTGGYEIIIPPKENFESAPKSSDLRKPRRRLLPASVMLLKEVNGFDMEIENPKVSKCSEGPVVTEQRGRRRVSSKLVHLLGSNLQ